MKRKSNILYVIPKWPYPANEGGKKSLINTLRFLNTLEPLVNKIDVLVFDEEDQRIPEEVKKFNFHFIKTKKHSGIKKIIHLFCSFFKSPWIPITYTQYTSKNIKKQSQLFLNNHQFDLIIFNGPHVALPFQFESLKIPFVLREENIEFEIWNSYATQSMFPLKLFIHFQAHLVKKIELQIIEKSQLILAISKEDEVVFKEYQKTFYFPVCFRFSSPIPHQQDKKIKLLALSNWNWKPNIDGLIWFCKNVWPSFEHSQNYHLTIAGFGNLNPIKSFNLKNISIVGEVESVAEIYKNSDAVIAPLFYGGGIKVKTIEASLMGRIIIGSNEAFRGIKLPDHLSHYQCENIDQWKSVLTHLTEDQLIKDGMSFYEIGKNLFDENLFYIALKDKLIEMNLL